MTKADIVEKIALGTGVTKLETEAIVEGFLNTVIEALKEGHGIEIRGFGSWPFR
ncbi:MAG: HU family DNA-binding protein [Bacillota bacterium]